MLEWTAVLDLYVELRRIAEALDAAGVAYALAGGLAVSIYTTPRATEDIDLLIRREDFDRTVRAVEPLGFRPAGRPMRVAEGRMEIQRLIKIDGADVLPLDLLMPVDAGLASLLADRHRQVVEGWPLEIVGSHGPRQPQKLPNSPLDRHNLPERQPDQP